MRRREKLTRIAYLDQKDFLAPVEGRTVSTIELGRKEWFARHPCPHEVKPSLYVTS